MLKSRQIVIGVDFSPAGKAAIAEAHRISKIANMPITAVHALERSASCAMHEGYVHHQTNIHDEKVNKHKAKWQEVVAGLEAGGPINCVASRHSPAEALLEEAAPCKNSFLILGINDKDPFFPGASEVATQCVRHACSPVLLVSPKVQPPYKHVILATNFSSVSAIACRWADEIAAKYNSKFTAIHFVKPSEKGDPNIETRLKNFLSDHAPLTAERAESLVIAGDSDRGESIADYAREHGADLIVMGRKEHSMLHNAFHSSTVERVLKNSEINLLVLSPSAG